MLLPVAASKMSLFNCIAKQLLTECFPHLTKAQLEYLFFHSIRQTGVTWAQSRGVPLGLILVQSLWNIVNSARSYLVPLLEEHTLTTPLM